jgi:hypothetical protein
VKNTYTTFLLFLALFSAEAQVNTHLAPMSQSLDETLLNPIPEIILPEFNLTATEQADATDAKNGELPKFSRSIFTHITLDKAGIWTELSNGDRLWRVQITSKGAQALLPYFDRFYLPPGSMLHVYTPEREEVIGAFLSDNNPTDGYYATGLLHGESCILEYFEPHKVKGEGIISLNELGHAYRWVNKYFPKHGKTDNDTLGFGVSDACEVNVNCSEGIRWQQQKRAVVCMIVQSSIGQGICSGTLLNNVRHDCTPYLLSAQHCSAAVAANQYSQFLFYFNYEAPNCNTPSSIGTLGNSFIAGCSKKSDSNDNGGDTGSDFLLLQLNNHPPSSYNAFYAGWNNINFTSDSGTCIHHPNGDIKKISTYSSRLIDTTWWNVSGTHWLVRWSITPNGQGVTETGSSGAPLFNKAGQVIGKLTGGDSYCFAPDEPDYFGKVAYDWTSNGTSLNRQLKPWLDPDNTGTTSINGREADCVLSSADNYQTEVSIRLSPNPSSGIFYIGFEEEGNKKISIYDALGRLMIGRNTAEKNLTIDMQAMPKGLYILLIETTNGRAVKKLILNTEL